jgi:FtsH-binding integral membrane protein
MIRDWMMYVILLISLFYPSSQLLFAASPLIVLAYILLTAFEDPEAEQLKRRKKGDFELDGHGE